MVTRTPSLIETVKELSNGYARIDTRNRVSPKIVEKIDFICEECRYNIGCVWGHRVLIQGFYSVQNLLVGDYR